MSLSLTLLMRQLDPESFGGVIQRLLPEKQSVAGLARQVGVSYTFLWSLVKGERAGKVLRPSGEMVEKVIAGLEVMGVALSDRDRLVLMFSSSSVSDASRNLALYGGRIVPINSPLEILTQEEALLLNQFRTLSDHHKSAVKELVDTLAEKSAE